MIPCNLRCISTVSRRVCIRRPGYVEEVEDFDETKVAPNWERKVKPPAEHRYASTAASGVAAHKCWYCSDSVVTGDIVQGSGEF